MSNTSILSKAVFILLAVFSMSVFAVTPDEPLSRNPSYKINTDQRSIEIQGLGNKILDEASSARYLVRMDNDGTEYAYNLKRLGSRDLGYTGDPEDIAGYIFFLLTVYIDGTKVQEQTTAFIPSEYSNAIKFLKMDRDENKAYNFDFGMDSNNRVYIITSPTDVVYLDKKETIKKPVSIREKNKRFIQ